MTALTNAQINSIYYSELKKSVTNFINVYALDNHKKDLLSIGKQLSKSSVRNIYKSYPISSNGMQKYSGRNYFTSNQITILENANIIKTSNGWDFELTSLGREFFYFVNNALNSIKN